THDDVDDLDDQQFIVHGPNIHAAQNKPSEERTANKEVPLSSEEQALHDELVNLMHQESLAKLHNDAQRNAFEKEKKRIALEKGKECVDSTFTLSTANTPPQSTGNTPTDSDDDVPKDGVFSTNSFDDEHTDTEEDGPPDYNNMDHTIDVSSTPTHRIHKIHPQSQIIGKSTAGVQTRRKLKESTSNQHQALLSFIYKQNRTNHKDQQTCLFACFLSQEEPKKVSQALADESWVEAMQEELLQFKLQDVWVLCDLPDGKRVIGTKWVFRNKRDERGTIIKNKARLVAQGYRQEEGVDYDEWMSRVHSYMGNITEEVIWSKQPPGLKILRIIQTWSTEWSGTLWPAFKPQEQWFERLSHLSFETMDIGEAIDKTFHSKVKDFEDLMPQGIQDAFPWVNSLSFWASSKQYNGVQDFKSLQRFLFSYMLSKGIFKTDQLQEDVNILKKTGSQAMKETTNCGYLLYRSRICSSLQVVGDPDLIGPWLNNFGLLAFSSESMEYLTIRAKVGWQEDFDFWITPLTPSMLEVVTALAAEEEHSTSPHSRAASSARDAQGTPTQSAAHSQRTASVQGTASFHSTAVPHDSDAVQGTDTLQGTAAYHGTASVPKSPNDYTPTDASQTSGGDEGLLDIYALNREVKRLKRQTLSQAKLIRKLKTKLKNLSQVVAPVVKHHAFWVENQNLKKQKRRRKKHKKKVSSVKLGRNKDEGTLSEEHNVQEEDTAHPFFDDIVDKDAAVTPDLERKSDETEEVNIEEKEASNVKVVEKTEELEFETTSKYC
ncbi:putative ribonuclease H-like domain-containing protein, partial [Tanacetum coccineum]